MMWLLLFICVAHTELLMSQAKGENWLILKGENNPCEGHVEAYHNRTWGYVGDKGWNRTTEEVVCRSIHCGTPVSTEDTQRDMSRQVWLNELACKGTESQLWDCQYPGWGISYYRKDTVKKISCSNQIKISLDGFRCEGAVQYSIDGKTPSGYFCSEDWGKKEADILCESLECGKSREIHLHKWRVWKGFQNSKKMMIKCDPDIIKDINNLWQCATQQSTACQYPASVICTNHKRLQLKGNASNVCSGRLEEENDGKWSPMIKPEVAKPDIWCQQMHCGINISYSTGSSNGKWSPMIKPNNATPDIWCQQMHCGNNISYRTGSSSTQLTCTDNVNVVLMDNGKPSKCYGAVYIKVNETRLPVCATTWDSKEAEVVCRELQCGKVVSIERKPAKQGIMDSVECLGNESSLWHCRAKRDNYPLQCRHSAYVVCAASISVRLMDGPGKCAGRVEIQHEGRWKRVNKNKWTDTSSDVACKQMNCGKQRKSSNEIFSKGSGDFLTKAVTCQPNASSGFPH
uniref:SRCR domain-containing protein n=1 Tax=Monopterus albus TaxID=43700 RepID=A0A3Q3QZH5_MONAL|nr:scavenger receptor cysteine-rich type 1 protein M160-like [Monopterus albus]